MEIQDNAVGVSDALLKSLRRIAGSITQNCPDYQDDAVSIMVIAILEWRLKEQKKKGKTKKRSVTYIKRVAVSKLMEEIFRSRKYLFYSNRNKFPVERYDEDPFRYNQRHQYHFPEDDLLTDLMIDRIFEYLDDDEKALLVMNFWGGLSFKSIGRIIGKSPSTIRNRRELLFDKIREMRHHGYS